MGDVYADDIYVAKSGTVSGDVYANRLFCEGHIAGVAFVRDILIAGIRADDMRLSHTPPTMQFFNHDHKEQAYAKPLHLKLIR